MRWNCKAGKCGSCSAEINGKPRLMCMTRLEPARPRRAGHRRADAGLPADQGPGDRRVVELPGQEEDQAVQAAAARRAGRHLAHGSRPTSTACRSSASASSASCARTSATSCATTTMHDEFIGPRFLVYAAALEMHPLDTEDRAARSEGRRTASATATSPSAARRSAPRTSRSPTTRSSRSRSASSTSSTIRSRSCSGCSARGVQVLPARRSPWIRAQDALAGASRALAKAERYRLLNEPGEAESICLDILAVDPDNQEALITLLLALTDQFDHEPTSRVAEAWRRGRAAARRLRARLLRRHHPRAAREGAAARTAPGCGPRVYEWLREAMDWYERAEADPPGANDDALLRWNACARLIMRDHHLSRRRRAGRAAFIGVESKNHGPFARG